MGGGGVLALERSGAVEKSGQAYGEANVGSGDPMAAAAAASARLLSRSAISRLVCSSKTSRPLQERPHNTGHMSNTTGKPPSLSSPPPHPPPPTHTPKGVGCGRGERERRQGPPTMCRFGGRTADSLAAARS